jgi:hypothetical protein
MFEIFAGKVRSFKERFFLVRPKSVAALDNLWEVVKDDVHERRPFFHLCWSQDHFIYEPRDFGRTVANLIDEEKSLRQQHWAFIESLPQRVKTDRRGNPLMSADGTSVTEPRLINTHELLTSEDFEACLGSLLSFCLSADFLIATLLFCSPKLTKFPFLCVAGKMKDLGALVNAASKKISAKKKRKNVQSLEHLIAGSAPG